MSLFQPSTVTWAQAKSRVASVAGSSADTDQLPLAGYFLEEAFRNWEAVKDWKYLLTNIDISITSGTSLYDLPTDFRKIYSVRISVGNPRVLAYIDKRDYDKLRPNQSGSSTPYGYMLDHQWRIGSTGGQIELVPPNASTDTLTVIYYRTTTIPAGILAGTTASDALTLDIPLHYHSAILSWARALYLANKGGDDQRQAFWMKMAQDQVLKARSADEWVPDDSPGFSPGSTRATLPYSPNNILPWADY
jgi:hypothetical protein